MMQFFRTYGAPVFAAAALLLLVWMVWDLSGLGSNTGLSQRSSVGKINGSSVDARAYEEAVRQATEQQQRQGVRLGVEESQEIRNQVWEQFIQQRIMETEYSRRGIAATPDEIADLIKNQPPQEFRNVPDFQTDSQFDLAKYHRWLQSSVAQQYLPVLEAQARDEILRSKLLRVVTADVYLSDAALWQKYRDRKETVKVELVAIRPRNLIPDSAVSVTQAEVAKYYDDHRQQFERPRTAYLSYVQLPRVPIASDSAAALGRAEAVRKELLDGAPFAEVAKRESSDTVSGAKGGDLGEWSRGAFDPAFETAAFSQPINAISHPVLSQFGYHLIQVYQRKGNKAKARHILIPIEITGTHRDHLDAMADSMEALGAGKFDPQALDTVARVLDLPVLRSNPVQEGTQVQLGVQVVPEASIWAFQAKPGETSDIVEVSYAYFLFRLDSLRPAGVPPLSGIRHSVELAVRDVKKWDAARGVAADVLKRITEGSPLERAAKAVGAQYEILGPFTRVDPPFPEPAVIGTAFGLDSGEVSGLVETPEGLYILRKLAQTKPDSAEFAKQIDALRGTFIRTDRQNRVRYYLSALRDAAKVEDRRASLYRTDAQAQADAEKANPQGTRPRS